MSEVVINVTDENPKPNTALVDFGLNTSVYNKQQIDDKVTLSISDTVTPEMTLDQLNYLDAPTNTQPRPNGLYRASKDGASYANGLTAKPNVLTTFKKTGTTWVIDTEVSMPKSDNKIETWVAKPYVSGSQVNDSGLIWESTANVVSTDVPGVSPKWKPAQDSLTYIESKNRVNHETSVFKKVINAQGAIVDSSGNWYTTDLISSTANSQVTIQKARFIAQYNNSKAFISGTYVDNTNSGNVTITTNAACAFIRVTYLDTNSATVQVEYGSVATSVEPFYIKADRRFINNSKPKFPAILDDFLVNQLKKSNDIGGLIKEKSGNFKVERYSPDQLFDVNKKTDGFVINSNGNPSISTGFSVTDYIEIGSNTDVWINRPRTWIEYDENKVAILTTYVDNTSQAARTFKTTVQTKYIRVSLLTTHASIFIIALGTSPVPWTEFKDGNIVKQTEVGGSMFFQPAITPEFIEKLKQELAMGTDLKKINDKKLTNYPLAFETEDFKAYITTDNYNIIEAVRGDVAVKKMSETSFVISTNGIDGDYGATINLDSVTFPNLIAGSSIMKIAVIGWRRNQPLYPVNNEYRINIFTDKGQIYHNFPSRTPGANTPDGTYQTGDNLRWDESFIWDLPERRLPSKTEDNFPYMLNPCLPDVCYEVHPAANSDNGYGHGGYGVSNVFGAKSFPRFYIHDRTDVNCNPFFWMGGLDENNKMTIIATYRDNTVKTARMCVFISTDGGRNWFNKYEFSSNMPSLGNVLDGSKVGTAYTVNSLTCKKRTVYYPRESDKEPATICYFGNNITISNISNDAEMILTTTSPHGLADGETLCINGTGSNGFDFLTNNAASTASGGNGKFWKVKVITSTTFKLYEFLHNPNSNILARHIHSVNKAKDGFMIVTGEAYPQGNHIYMVTQGPETFDNNKFGWGDYDFIRLNSSDKAIARSLGTILFDDPEQTMLFGADEAYIDRGTQPLPPGRTVSLKRNSVGVFRGKLSDVDDMSKWTCVYEAKEICFGLRKTSDDLLVYIGQQGEVAVSSDIGNTWRYFKGRNGLPLTYPKGEDSKGRFVIDRMVIYRK